jgi:hypothetical protein
VLLPGGQERSVLLSVGRERSVLLSVGRERSVRGRDDAEMPAAARAVTVAREVVVLLRAGRRRRAGGLADRLGQRDQIVRGRRRWGELTVVANQLPAAGGGEAASVRFAQVVRVRLGEGREGADHGR